MARKSYKSEKRRRELDRLKKQAEKREKRFSKRLRDDADPEAPEPGDDLAQAPDQNSLPDGEPD